MSRFSCDCGEVISDTRIPKKGLNYLFTSEYLINDSSFGKALKSIIEKNPEIINSEDELEEFFVETISENSREVHECPNCKRIHVQEDTENRMFKHYKEEKS